LFKVPPEYVPKFKHHHRAYPLSKFKAYLTTNSSITKGTAACYVSAIRRMLFHLGEGQPGAGGLVKRRTWDNFEAVTEYVDGLSRSMQDPIKGAWRYWVNFNGAVTPPQHQLAPRVSKAAVTAALRALLHYRLTGKGAPPLNLQDIPKMYWEWDPNEQRWYITHGRGGSLRYTFGIGVRQLSDAIRNWGYPQGCPKHGASFVPHNPDDSTPMTLQQVKDTIDNKVPPAIVKWLDEAMAKDYTTTVTPIIESERLRMPQEIVEESKLELTKEGRIKTDFHTTRLVDTSDESFGRTFIVDGKLVVENPEDDGLPDWA
jgi:hypothetical protein